MYRGATGHHIYDYELYQFFQANILDEKEDSLRESMLVWLCLCSSSSYRPYANSHNRPPSRYKTDETTHMLC